MIFDKNIDVHVLDSKLNMFYEGNDIQKDNPNYNIHYTWKIKSEEHRYELIVKHYNNFKNILTTHADLKMNFNKEKMFL